LIQNQGYQLKWALRVNDGVVNADHRPENQNLLCVKSFGHNLPAHSCCRQGVPQATKDWVQTIHNGTANTVKQILDEKEFATSTDLK
jgi:hypothetical protein